MATNELLLYGSVGMSWWDEECFTSSWVRQQLKGMAGDVTVRINSGGGIATEGQAIYAALKDHPGKITVIVDAVAASAASLIAMAGDVIRVRRGAWMLVHDPASPWTLGRGTEEDHRREAEQLRVIAGAYADVYADRAGISRDEARAIMVAETVMDGPMAVDLGFATEVEEAEAVAAATFDYRLYAHAPEGLRKGCRNLGPAPEPVAIMAMIAGRARTPKPAEEAVMAVAPKTAVDTTAQTPPNPAGDPLTPAPVTVTVDMTAVTAAERARARRITDAVAAAGLPATMASDLIGDDKMTLEMALDRVTAVWKEKGDVDAPMTGRSLAVITRDERDTRRAGMTAALVAQMRGVDPADDKARPYMTKSLVEIAAICADWRDPIRTANDKIDVFMSGMHTRSDFAGIFENALNKSLLDQYEQQAPTYRQIARRRDFNDFRPHPLVRPGDMPRLSKVNEAGEIKFGTFGERRETAQLVAYGTGLNISRQMMIDDDLGAIDQVVGDYATCVASDEEEFFYAFMLTATLSSDSGAVWQAAAARGNNLAGTGTAITAAAVQAGRAVMRAQTGIESATGKADGRKLNLSPAILLVGPVKEMEAEQLVAPILAAQTGNVNPFSGKFRIVVTAQIPGNLWFLFADPARAGAGCFVYGFLNGAGAPRLRTQEMFGKQGVSLTVEHDFGFGANDFRGSYRNPGA